MSEYQCYEFLALDRPLTTAEMAQLRDISSRAEISTNRFWNEYHWGSLNADPQQLLARYFDAFLYFANWGSHHFMMRLPANRVDLQQLKQYFPGRPSKLVKKGKYVILVLRSETEEPEDDWSEAQGQLSMFAVLRTALMQGDMSAAYLAWLLAVQEEELSPSAKEPPVPAGLKKPNASLTALATFLRIDPDLIAACAEGGKEDIFDATQVRSWVLSLSGREKDRWLAHAVDEPSAPVGAELIAEFRRQHPSPPQGRPRTVSELLARAEALRAQRNSALAKRQERDRLRAQATRHESLAALTKQGVKAWHKLARLIEDRHYDEAATLTVDLRDAALLSGREVLFQTKLAELRKQHARRKAYLDRLKRLGLS